MSDSDPLPTHSHQAVRIVIFAILLDAVYGIAFGLANHVGVWYGLYFATTTASTVGYGDITPVGWLPHLLAVLIMVNVVPLFAATFSLFTSGLTSTHVKHSEARIKEHVENRLKHHLGADSPDT